MNVWANTIYSIKGEASGQVWIPADVHIQYTKVMNTFLYNQRSSADNSAWSKVLNLGPGLNVIPEPVLELQVKIGKKARVDAVVVVEHRNVLEVMAQDDYGVKNVIIVMVSLQLS